MPDVKLTIKGKDLASGAVKGMTGSLVKAQLAVQGVMMAASKLVAIHLHMPASHLLMLL